MTVIEHDGKQYVALKASSSWEDSDTADVCVIEFTPEVLDAWRTKIALVKELKRAHDINYAAWVDYSAEWRHMDFDNEPIDADGDIYPVIWTDDPEGRTSPARTDLDRIEVMESGIEFCAFGKHTNERLFAYVDADDIEHLAVIAFALAEKGRAKGKSRRKRNAAQAETTPLS